MSELKEALGRGTEVVFGGKTLTIEPLDFNDLCDLEEFAGINADDLDAGEFLQATRNKRFFLWLVLRKADPDLTQQERESGEYRLTEKEAGYQIKFGTGPEQFALINAALGVSGLTGPEEAEESTDPKPQAAKTPRKPKGSAPAA